MMDEDFNLEDELNDVLISHPSPTPPSSSGGYVKKSSIFKQEMQKQLEQSCFEISSWCEQICQTSVSSDIETSLRDGVILCHVAEILYPSNPPFNWIQSPQEYMDYNVNIAAFSDHCVSIGIDESMIIDYTMFDDRNLARLVTCLLEYIDHYHSVCSQDLPHPTYPVDEESKQTVDYSYISTEMTNPLDSLLETEAPKKKRGLFSCCMP